METKKTRAVAYCRVSLAQQNSELQVTNIKEFCNHRGFNLQNIYIDHGIGGAKESRPQLNQMVKDARMGKFDVLVVTGIDRLGRSTRHLLNLIHEISGYGVSLISLRESIDLSSSIGQATLAILSVVAQLEKDLLRERIKSALYAKKLASEKTGWRCGRPQLVTPAIRSEVLSLRSQGMSIRKIERAIDKKISHTAIGRIIKEHCQQTLLKSDDSASPISITYEVAK